MAPFVRHGSQKASRLCVFLSQPAGVYGFGDITALSRRAPLVVPPRRG